MKKALMLAAIMGVGFFGECAWATSTQVASARIAAVVNKKIISISDLNARIQLAALSSGVSPDSPMVETLRPQILRAMIDEQLQLQAMKEFNIEVSKEDLEKGIDNLEKTNQLPSGYIKKFLNDHNIPQKTLTNQLEAQIGWIKLIREMYMSSLQISEREIEESLKQAEENQQKTHYHVAEIFLPIDKPDQEAHVRDLAERLYDQLAQGASFSSLAQQFSQSPTAAQGGDLGWLVEGSLDQVLEEKLMQMQPGQMTTPMRTSAGYIMLAMMGRKSPQSEDNEMITFKQALYPIEGEKTDANLKIAMDKANQLAKAMRSCETFDKVIASKPSIQHQTVDNAPFEQLPEPLQRVMKDMKEDTISKALPTEDGALLLMICKREKQASLSRDVILNNIVQQRLMQHALKTMRDLRARAFIDIRQ